MSRISTYHIREYVEGLNLTAGELVELIGLSVSDIVSKFPNRLKSCADVLGYNDMRVEEEEDGEASEIIQSFSETEGY